jgi:hypothetical protein
MRLIFIILFSLSSFANQVYEYSKDKPLYINISTEYNRIGFSYLKVIEVLGNNLKFEVLPYSATYEVVFVPKAKLGEKLEVSFVLDTGLVQEAVLIVSDILPQVVEIKTPLPYQMLEVKQTSTEEQVEGFLKRVLENKVQLNVIKTKKINLSSFDGKIIGFFKQKGLTAYLLDIKNKSKEAILVPREELHKIFPSTVKIYSPKDIFKRREKSQILVITRVL